MSRRNYRGIFPQRSGSFKRRRLSRKILDGCPNETVVLKRKRLSRHTLNGCPNDTVVSQRRRLSRYQLNGCSRRSDCSNTNKRQESCLNHWTILHEAVTTTYANEIWKTWMMNILNDPTQRSSLSLTVRTSATGSLGFKFLWRNTESKASLRSPVRWCLSWNSNTWNRIRCSAKWKAQEETRFGEIGK